MTLIVTGGAGFIGSALVRALVARREERVVNVDKLTYAGNLESLEAVADDANYSFERVDICDSPALVTLFSRYKPRAVLHLAAESHVDRSIDSPGDFINTNVTGTYTLLREALRYWRGLNSRAQAEFRFVHVSTDEVFGSLGETGLFNEEMQYRPNSPYSASKAASDHLVRAWCHTYGLPTITSNCSNNYGPFQFPEKLIPLTILNAIDGKALPVYGQGTNVRDWLHVEDHVSALLTVLERGRPGETYCVGGGNELRNIEVVRRICAIVDELCPEAGAVPRERLITFVDDRPGHDQRYAIDASKIRGELGWRPAETFETGLRKTVAWYLENRRWSDRVRSGSYQGERLGLGVSG